MSGSDRAFSAGLWALSDAGFRRAWAAGEASARAGAFRYALLRNWGHHLAGSQGPEAQAAAARLLATAVAVAAHFQLPGGAGEACQDLKTFFGYPDCQAVAADMADVHDPALGGAE